MTLSEFEYHTPPSEPYRKAWYAKFEACVIMFMHSLMEQEWIETLYTFHVVFMWQDFESVLQNTQCAWILYSWTGLLLVDFNPGIIPYITDLWTENNEYTKSCFSDVLLLLFSTLKLCLLLYPGSVVKGKCKPSATSELISVIC
jgi:hypothetical protein